MPIVVQCPSCTARIKVPDNRVGQRVKCPGCRFQFLAVSQESAAARASPEPQPQQQPPTDPFDFFSEEPPTQRENPFDFTERPGPLVQEAALPSAEQVGYRCPFCKTSTPAEREHRIEWGVLSNAVTVCLLLLVCFPIALPFVIIYYLVQPTPKRCLICPKCKMPLTAPM